MIWDQAQQSMRPKQSFLGTSPNMIPLFCFSISTAYICFSTVQSTCRVVPCCVASCRVVSCRVVSCCVVSYRVVSCRVVSYRVVLCRVVSCRVVSCCVVSCRVVSCCVVLCRVLFGSFLLHSESSIVGHLYWTALLLRRLWQR